MAYDPLLAEIRFGFGLSPLAPPPSGAAELLEGIHRPDVVEHLAPIPPFSEAVTLFHDLRDLRRADREARGTSREEAVAARLQATSQEAVKLRRRNLGAAYIRASETRSGFRERLVAFWADHFTVRAKSFLFQHLVAPYVEEAIRPRIAMPYARLLKEAVLHPMMLAYLDQTPSIGPNSRAAEEGGGGGLNENLARELLELHTIGAGGPYSQMDVRELAELLTGVVWYQDEPGRSYRPRRAEPGAEVVLGRTFSSEAELRTVMEALEFLAAHPATARHVSAKLARSFVAEVPPADLVDAMASTWEETGGDLAAVYAAMLAHPAAWGPERTRIKPPFDFIASSLRALAIGRTEITPLPEYRVWSKLGVPLRGMGQPWESPVGPDGWPEAAAAWVTPQFYAARISWAMRTPAGLTELPDPRAFAITALGPLASPELRFAALAAETRGEGIGVILASPDFQRR
ncbi:DUF1800 domain-containing protein [Pseudoroseicyclus tamaricis]|uniref:DUF1800 domain-containing protein n=1 Tax=Pseudoroseicyclus tamaricis TaxID=2705421 RepID=A0A6B2JFS3_9RHOB|nr:DUF1800 domain-containing protein [Pseudoroseicyclus tamaricis]NDU99912.1 DUF1800 domain-containing protein [Pseudoroseicyclus tamaricis]